MAGRIGRCFAAIAVVGALVSSGPPASAQSGFDVGVLDEDPVIGWGVNGSGGTQMNSPQPYVWAFAETAGRLFVGGTFQTVSDGFPGDPGVTEIAQPYLAAFDTWSGEYIDTFTPTFDYAVHALTVTPGGQLLVGGEFTTVNGTAREGLVALDPLTGAIDSTFATEVERIWSADRALVREFRDDGASVIITGDFDHIKQNGASLRVWSSARLNATSGLLDPAFLPRLLGSSGWDIDLDDVRDEVHFAGNFYSVDGEPGTAHYAAVDSTTGDVVPGMLPFENNTPSGQTDTTSVIYAADRIYVGGAQHVVQVLDPADHSRIGYMTTGFAGGCEEFSPCNGFNAGGDTQTMERIGDYVLNGGHFHASFASHYSTFDDDPPGDDGWHHQEFVATYDIATSQNTETFVPNLLEGNYNTWAIFANTHDCLFLGGDFQQSGYQYTGGFARFCPPDTDPPTTPQSVVGTPGVDFVDLSWDSATDNRGVTGYLVHDNWSFVQWVQAPTTTWTHTGLAPGSVHKYQVRAEDAAGNLSPPSPLLTVVIPGDQPPTTPPNVTAAPGVDFVDLAWDPATDDIGVTGYLVHDNWSFVQWLPGETNTSWSHTGLVPGSTHRYQVRAQDTAGQNSPPSPLLTVIVGADTDAPTTPANVTAAPGATWVDLEWDESTDNIGVTGYLVHDNWAYVAWVPGATSTTYTHSGLAPGSVHKYQIRAQDAAGNNSPPSPILTVTLP